jgi:hypothetical protein
MAAGLDLRCGKAVVAVELRGNRLIGQAAVILPGEPADQIRRRLEHPRSTSGRYSTKATTLPTRYRPACSLFSLIERSVCPAGLLSADGTAPQRQKRRLFIAGPAEAGPAMN